MHKALLSLLLLVSATLAGVPEPSSAAEATWLDARWIRLTIDLRLVIILLKDAASSPISSLELTWTSCLKSPSPASRATVVSF